MRERGASEDEVAATVAAGEQFPAKYDRTAFRRNFVFDGLWRDRRHHMKQVEVYAIWEDDDWLVISVLGRDVNCCSYRRTGRSARS